MIGTITTKNQQLTNGFFKTGNGIEVILIVGSCRSIPYLNYLNEWNNQNGERFTIIFIDPFNWSWDTQDKRVNCEQQIQKQESNESLLNILKQTKYFLHEYYQNYGMFNCSKKSDKNIYQFGLNPNIDITIPSFNDLFILSNDIVCFDLEIRKKAIQDYNVIGELSESTQKEMLDIGQKNLEKFYSVCDKSDIPEMKQYFKDNLKATRFFWTSNHISKHFTLEIFRLMNDKFLNLELSKSFWNEISKEDIYANNYTFLTDYDLKWYGFEWNEEIKPLTI